MNEMNDQLTVKKFCTDKRKSFCEKGFPVKILPVMRKKNCETHLHKSCACHDTPSASTSADIANSKETNADLAVLRDDR